MGISARRRFDQFVVPLTSCWCTFRFLGDCLPSRRETDTTRDLLLCCWKVFKNGHEVGKLVWFCLLDIFTYDDRSGGEDDCGVALVRERDRQLSGVHALVRVCTSSDFLELLHYGARFAKLDRQKDLCLYWDSFCTLCCNYLVLCTEHSVIFRVSELFIFAIRPALVVVVLVRKVVHCSFFRPMN